MSTNQILTVQKTTDIKDILAHYQTAPVIVLKNSTDISIIKTLSAHPNTAHIPIIIITEEKNVSQAIACGADDYLIPPIDKTTLQQKITLAIKRTKKYQQFNPLTLLPGNRSIKKIITQRLDQSLAILYFDIDNFKQYNDNFGFYLGDKIIIKTAQIIRSAVTMAGKNSDFIGHLGGDDFIVISTKSTAQQLYQHVKTEFYNTITKKSPHLTLSIAILDNTKENMTSLENISFVVAKYKKMVKKRKIL